MPARLPILAAFLAALAVPGLIAPDAAAASNWSYEVPPGGRQPVATSTAATAPAGVTVERVQIACPTPERWQFFVDFLALPAAPSEVGLSCDAPQKPAVTSCWHSTGLSGVMVYCPRQDVRQFLGRCTAAKALTIEFGNAAAGSTAVGVDFAPAREAMVEMTRRCGG